jgi:cysteine desulfurase
MTGSPVYLDHHATTPCDPRVLERMLPFFSTDFGNASSRQHAFGRRAHEAVGKARRQVAGLIGADPEEIVFTSGATEAVNLAIRGAAAVYAGKGRHIVTCETEHAAVLDTCRSLEKSGFEVTLLPVDSQGRLGLEALAMAIRDDTFLVCLMSANNETGVLQDLRSISALCREKGVLLFTDATQSAGKVPIDVDAPPVDMMCLSAHKFHGPKGVGALYVRRSSPRVRLAPLLEGGGHEKGLRSGTLNVTGIVGMGEAAEIAQSEMTDLSTRVRRLRDSMEQRLSQASEVYVNGGRADRLPTVTNLSFRFVEGQALLSAVCSEVAVSTGSACSSASMDPSHVLTAMGLGRDAAYASLRISLARTTTEEETSYAAERILHHLEELRSSSPVWRYASQGLLPDPEGWRHPDAVNAV